MLSVIDEATCDYKHTSPTVVRKRAERYLEVVRPYADIPLDSRSISVLIKDVTDCVSATKAKQVYRQELRSLGGMRWSLQSLVGFACRLAGGYDRARLGLEVGLLASDWPETDGLLRVKQVEVVSNVNAVRLHFVACNTRYAGTTFKTEFATSKIASWLGRFGAFNYRKKIITLGPRHFLNLHAIGRMLTTNGGDELVGVCCPKDVKLNNRRLVTSRHRSQAPCPFGATFDCVACSVGVNQCDMSCSHVSTDFKLEKVYPDDDRTTNYEG